MLKFKHVAVHMTRKSIKMYTKEEIIHKCNESEILILVFGMLDAAGIRVHTFSLIFVVAMADKIPASGSNMNVGKEHQQEIQCALGKEQQCDVWDAP